MENELDRALYAELVGALTTARLLRRAKNLENPEDVPVGSHRWDAVNVAFWRDVWLAMGRDPDELGKSIV
jgi:hypothetical protein